MAQLSMDIAEIAERTGIGLRRLRYVLDHDVVQFAQNAGKGRGSARVFTENQAFGISCAALLMEAGLRRSATEACMKILDKTQSNKDPFYESLLEAAYFRGKFDFLEIADGMNLRLRNQEKRERHETAPRWTQISTGAELKDGYNPLVIVSINIGALTSRLKR